MPIEAQYETYYGIHLNHYTYTWGGSTYNKLLTQEYPSDELKSTTSTQTATADFLYSKLVGNPTYMDGVAEGHVTFFNSSSGASATIDDYTVTLYKTVDVPSSATVIGSYSVILSSDNIIAKVGTTWGKNDGGKDEDDTLVVPVNIVITEKEIDINEKIFLRISYNSTNGTVWIGHYNGSDPDDIKIKIPYSPVG